MEKTARDFYDDIAAYYDDMTRFQQRIDSEKHVLQSWIDKYRFKHALDAACGSGLHAIVLTRLGITVSGADVSAQMIARANQNARASGLHIRFKKSAIKNIDQCFKSKFDTALILGNSLPHLISRQELNDSLKSIQKVLTHKGYLIVQILNYDLILEQEQRVISISRNINQEYIRFYDFIDPYLRFNLLHLTWDKEDIHHKMSSTIMYPYTFAELSPILSESGYRIVDTFGSMNFDTYDRTESKNLIIVAQTD